MHNKPPNFRDFKEKKPTNDRDIGTCNTLIQTQQNMNTKISFFNIPVTLLFEYFHFYMLSFKDFHIPKFQFTEIE